MSWERRKTLQSGAEEGEALEEIEVCEEAGAGEGGGARAATRGEHLDQDHGARCDPVLYQAYPSLNSHNHKSSTFY